tara:strand:+ start:130 stop:405 length:276 start_codon:yes stop_codon:yes gene_type:complete
MRKLYALTDNQAQFIKEKFPRAKIGNGIAPFTEAERDALGHFIVHAVDEITAIDFGTSHDDPLRAASESQWRAMERGTTKILRLSSEGLKQ